MQPPALERRSAVYKAQSLGSSLIHTIPAPHQRLPCLEDTALLFTRYQPPHSGCRVWKTLLSYSHNTSPPTAAAVFGRHCSLIHTIPAPPQRSAVCRGHSLIHMIPAPHQRLPCFGRHCSFIHTIPASHQRMPCVEDSALSLIQGDMKPLLQSLTHSPVVKRPPPQSGSESYYETARKSEESPDAPAQKSARR